MVRTWWITEHSAGRQDVAWYMPTLDRIGFGAVDRHGDVSSGIDRLRYEWRFQLMQPIWATRMPDNNAVLYYTFDGATKMLNEKIAVVIVRQPNLKNNNFTTSRLDWSDGDEEIGERVRFQIIFRNTGGITGYDLTVCDDLPQGLGYFPGSTTYNPPVRLFCSPDGVDAGRLCGGHGLLDH